MAIKDRRVSNFIKLINLYAINYELIGFVFSCKRITFAEIDCVKIRCQYGDLESGYLLIDSMIDSAAVTTDFLAKFVIEVLLEKIKEHVENGN